MGVDGGGQESKDDQDRYVYTVYHLSKVDGRKHWKVEGAWTKVD
jgi:hypothetical protein